MNIFKYADTKDNEKTYNYKILVYPNITYMKDLEMIFIGQFYHQ